ncbi:MAG TPA: hemerythrin domain-containing protein [Burkholderiaceae bacterium]|nr:hemerythrin domain-containing protein [Burkholderiaceae bacterium]
MNIDKFKQQHIEIIGGVAALRQCAKEGISENAAEISQLIISMSSIIKLHLAVEDKILYPALQNGNNSALARMGKKFQDEMTAIASAYMDFARRWNSASKVSHDPEGFRSDANKVLKILHDRMQKENTDFYPAIEAL